MRLLDALAQEARGRRRLDQTAVWRAFARAHPVEAGSAEARERLAARLTELAAEDRLVLPAVAGQGWDRSARPPLPEWVRLPATTKPTAKLDLHSTPWAPELGFVPSLGWTDRSAELQALQQFFTKGGRMRPLVPMRERSVQLFGDEKLLDCLVKGPLFGEGRLDLAALRCFAMAPPLVYEDGPPAARGRPVLVVENHHTWWSFCRWNAKVSAYSSVVFGAGKAFARDAVAFVAEKCQELRAPHAHYFGDLDPTGLYIPNHAATAYAPVHGLHILPAIRWYRLLLERAEEVPLPTGPCLPEEGLDWLPVELRGKVIAHFEAGRRVPQELVGTEVLARHGIEEEGVA
jgi:hypothetical protein